MVKKRKKEGTTPGSEPTSASKISSQNVTAVARSATVSLGCCGFVLLHVIQVKCPRMSVPVRTVRSNSSPTLSLKTFFSFYPKIALSDTRGVTRKKKGVSLI